MDLCFAKDGTLFVAELNRILSYAKAERRLRQSGAQGENRRRAGEKLIPPEDESLNPQFAGLPRRPRQQALCYDWAALQRAAEGQTGGIRQTRHRRHFAHGP